MGFSVLTFDWTQISWIGSPLMGTLLVIYAIFFGLICSAVPWWAEVHIFLGFVLFYWILTPALYYSNVRSTRSPFLSCNPILGSPGPWPTSQFLVTSPTTGLARSTMFPVYSRRTTASI